MSKRIYLVSLLEDYPGLQKAEVADKIEFEMPPFCSGDYNTIVCQDKYGLFVYQWYHGCRDFAIVKATQAQINDVLSQCEGCTGKDCRDFDLCIKIGR